MGSLFRSLSDGEQMLRDSGPLDFGLGRGRLESHLFETDPVEK